MKYGIDYGRQPGKSVFWKETGKYIDGKTYETIYWDEMTSFTEYEQKLLFGRTLEDHDTSGNTEEETPEHLRARWLSVRVLQVTGLAHLGPSAAQIRGMGRLTRFIDAFRSKSRDVLPDVQFVTAEWLREKLLHQDELEDRRAVEDHLAQSLSSSKENPR